MNVASKSTPVSKGKSFSRKQLWALAGMSLIVMLIYFVLGSLLLAKRGQMPVEVQVEPRSRAGLTLQSAQQAAQDVALAWQPDALLVGATTSWQLASGERLTLSRAAWSFSFYSPAIKKVQVVIANQDGAALSRQTGVDSAPQPVRADWSLGADDLLLTFMAAGGEEFIKFHSHANIHVQLQVVDAERAVWAVSAVDPVAQESFTMRIDALSRQVVTD